MATTTELPGSRPPETSRAGLVEWVVTVDHKRIGLLYVGASLLFFLAGGVLAMFIRAELAAPGLQVMGEVSYNQAFTMHGTLMIFLFSVPIFTGLGNYLLPLQIGAADVAFPRLNALGFWLFLFGGLVVVTGWLISGDQPGQAESFADQFRRLAGVPAPDPHAREEVGTEDLGVLPYPSVWPFVLGLGLTMALTGLVFGFWVLIVGVALATVAAVGWQRAVNREQRYGRLGRVQASDGEWRPPVR